MPKKIQPKLKLTRMDGESTTQYWAWLLYCETGSIDKMLAKWRKIEAGESPPETLTGFEEKIDKAPSRTTIIRWLQKFRWLKRRERQWRVQCGNLFKQAKKARAEQDIKFVKALEQININRNDTKLH